MKDDAELKEKTLALEKANKDLEISDKQKTEFFIHLAHETKTPLTLIKNYLEKYIKKTGMNEDLLIIKQNVDILLRNMINFLDAEKISRGQIFYDHEQVTDISSLIRDKILIFRTVADKKGISIDSDIQPGIFLRIDPFAADRIMNNLLDNAITYTNPKGRISVQLYRHQGNIMIKVTDNGTGLTKEQRKSIFLPYNQYEKKKRHIKGMGIGLYLVKQIIDSLHGDIRVESKVNKGTTFGIVIKKERTALGLKSAANTELSIPIIRHEIIDELKDEKTSAHKKNIFIIDDDRQMLFFLRSFLKDEYNVYLATNGKEALEKIPDIPKPEVIIADIVMDEMDGHSFLMHLYNMDEYIDIPLIFISARNNIPEKIKGISGGAIDYIYKPFNIEELKEKIHSIIRNKQAYKKYIIHQIEKLLRDTLQHDAYPDRIRNKTYSFQEICRRKRLSMRETEVIICLKEGLLNKEISGRLNISISTVEYHLRNIYHKFNVQNRVELLNQLNAEGLG